MNSISEKTTQPIKVGVIGAGYWGPNLIRNFHEIPSADLAIVCDKKPERLKHIQNLYPNVAVTTDINEVLTSEVEAIAIATPVFTHYPIAIECLHAGKNILIEKPFAANSQQAREILHTAQKKELLAMSGHTFLYNPAVLAIKKIISSGQIGQIYYINCTRVNLGLYQPDVNVIWDLAPHDISILMFILGLDPLSASARGGMYVKPGIHDVAHISIFFPDGIMADLRLSWLDPVKIRKITIVGSKKMLVYDDIEPVDKVRIYDKGVDIQPYSDTLEEFHLAYRHGEVTTYPINWKEPLKLECLSFLECIRENNLCQSDGKMGLKVVQVLETAQKSLLNGGIKETILW